MHLSLLREYLPGRMNDWSEIIIFGINSLKTLFSVYFILFYLLFLFTMKEKKADSQTLTPLRVTKTTAEQRSLEMQLMN